MRLKAGKVLKNFQVGGSRPCLGKPCEGEGSSDLYADVPYLSCTVISVIAVKGHAVRECSWRERAKKRKQAREKMEVGLKHVLTSIIGIAAVLCIQREERFFPSLGWEC